jgi:hypothetical protein
MADVGGSAGEALEASETLRLTQKRIDSHSQIMLSRLSSKYRSIVAGQYVEFVCVQRWRWRTDAVKSQSE